MWYAHDSHAASGRLVWISISGVSCPRNGHDKAQRAWDSIIVMMDFNEVVEQATTDIDKAQLLAVQSPHTSDWLHALPLSACELRLDNKAIRVSVGLRLGLELCQLHSCPSGAVVDARGLHGLSYKKSEGRSLRHLHINDLIFRAQKGLTYLSQRNLKVKYKALAKKPDGLTLVPWRAGKALTWDASYLKVSPVSSGQAAEVATDHKKVEYSSVSTNHWFISVAVETMGSINQEGSEFLDEVGNCIAEIFLRTPRAHSF